MRRYGTWEWDNTIDEVIAMTQWRKKEKDATYSEEEIEARLKEELPGWYYEGGWIRI